MMFFFPSHLLVTLFFSTLFWVPHPGRFHWPDLLSKRVFPADWALAERRRIDRWGSEAGTRVTQVPRVAVSGQSGCVFFSLLHIVSLSNPHGVKVSENLFLRWRCSGTS